MPVMERTIGLRNGEMAGHHWKRIPPLAKLMREEFQAKIKEVQIQTREERQIALRKRAKEARK